jgi:signal transduction histidine kinase
MSWGIMGVLLAFATGWLWAVGLQPNGTLLPATVASVALVASLFGAFRQARQNTGRNSVTEQNPQQPATTPVVAQNLVSSIPLTDEELRRQLEQETIRTRALIEGQESERRRISQDLHDGVGQMLTAIKIHVSELLEHPERLPEVKALIEQTRDEIRHISNNLMPNVLMDFGLYAGLKLIAKNTTLHSGLPVRLRYESSADLRLRSELEITLYRIAQEAVNNALKYARASQLEIQFLPTEQHYILRVLDNGIGVKAQPQKAKGGQGLQTMQQRATLMGGNLRIVSSLARGTRVTVRVPRGEAALASI